MSFGSENESLGINQRAALRELRRSDCHAGCIQHQRLVPVCIRIKHLSIYGSVCQTSLVFANTPYSEHN